MDAKKNVTGWISKQMGGLSYLDYLQSLVKQVDTDWSSVSDDLDRIRAGFLCRQGALVNLTAKNELLTRTESHVASLLNALPIRESSKTDCSSSCLEPTNEGLVVPTQVNYIAKAANIYEAG